MKGKVWILVILGALFLLYFACDSEEQAPTTDVPRIGPAETESLKENKQTETEKAPPAEKPVAGAPQIGQDEKTEPPRAERSKVAEAEPKRGKGKQSEGTTEKLSYVLGLDVGSSLKDLETDIDLKQFALGVEDVLSSRNPSVTPDEAAQIKQDFADHKEAEHAEKLLELGKTNEREGRAFLEKNRGKPGVVTTESGLQYLVLEPGSGPKPGPSDRVKVHYRGTLLNGSEFDSSYKRGAASVFSLDSVIPGWSEAIALMPEGSKYRLFIPPHLAYGEDGAGRSVGPNATLIFEVELVSVLK